MMLPVITLQSCLLPLKVLGVNVSFSSDAAIDTDTAALSSRSFTYSEGCVSMHQYYTHSIQIQT